ncbi:MAG: hypothetical protein H7645_04650 [Candidatus Heimdallarchaeota archaeon]|nr:hypothetical protein [Candidatus Heimdallarchaeota archaeon]MCK4769607.1 hypothetical protein [Candidatus Heimdallarchaeota archaeon]
MRIRTILKTLILIVLITNLQSSNVTSFNTDVVKEQNYTSYIWLWEELNGAPGNIPGEDVVFWGDNLGPYHNYTEMVNKLEFLNESFPEIVDLFSLGKTWSGNEIWCVKLTNETVTTAKSEYYVVGNHHARELISVENSLYFLDRIIYETQFGNFTNLLSNMELYVIPMLNPDGLSIIHNYPPQRKNIREIDDDGDGTIIDEYEIVYFWNTTTETSEIMEIDLDGDLLRGEDLPGGVDLNRNYIAFWNVSGGSSPNKIDSTYRGVLPFSENETQIMRDFMQEHFFNFAVSLHSGIQAIISPWGYNGSYPIAEGAEFIALLSELKSITSLPSWEEIPGSYNASGTWDDYSYLYHNIMCFTLETYSGFPSGSFFDDYNPSGNEILANCEMVFPALTYLASEPQLTYSNTPPSLVVTNPSKVNQVFDNYTIRWSMSDAEDDPLNCSVLVSGNGWNWAVLASNIMGSTSLFWDVKDLTPGSYYLKVAVTDGENWISDVSDIKLNVKQEPPKSRASFWILAVFIGGSAVVYLFFYIRKTKKIGKDWEPDSYKESQAKKNKE